MPTKKTTTSPTTKKAAPAKKAAPKKAAPKRAAKTTKPPRTTAARPPKRTETEGSSSVRAATSSSVPPGSNLVIVESPTKAKTISKYLGRGYAVRASYGHVRDLPKSKLGVDVEHDFTPQYLIPRDKAQTVKGLKADVERARAVYLATDPDREGEAIAWHLLEATNAGAGHRPVYRVEFHEVTRDAVQEALAHPRQIDVNLVNAQQARRILDRLVGYSISPILWKKVKGGLSAGRVQSVAVRMVVEREREIEAFVPVEYWSIEADLAKRSPKPKKGDQFHTQLISIKGKKAELHNAAEAHAVVSDLAGADYVVDSVKTREVRRNPSAPFTTSTLQQEASRKLGFTTKRTMIVAQQLYEGVDLPDEGSVGLITYMRTDSTNVAAVAQQEAREVITDRYGAAYLPPSPPVYSKKAKGAQEAHEAIRPSSSRRDPERIKAALSTEQYKLYKLIWQRFVASQMAAAVMDSTTVDVAAGKGATKPYIFRATGSVVKFPGFLAVYQEGIDDPTAGDEFDKKSPPLPLLAKHEPLDLIKLWPEQHFTQPPPRYTEATLVKALEEQGIGRPSTYAPTIGTIQERGYVTRDDKKLLPTELGMVVNDLLVQHFPNIVDLSFTSTMEQELDEIADGERPWVPVLHRFYDPFAATLKLAEEAIGPVKVADTPAGITCEKCGREMVIKLSRYGKFIACPGFPECRNTKPMPETKTGATCPSCHEGEIMERRSKKGRTFYGCDRYPECDFVMWDRPLPTPPCPNCGGLLSLRGRDGEQVRCIACGYTSTRSTLAPTATPLARPHRPSGNGHTPAPDRPEHQPTAEEEAELAELFA